MPRTCTEFGNVLQELMDSRGIKSQEELVACIKQAGYPRRAMTPRTISKWMLGVNYPADPPRDFFFLHTALGLTDEESVRLALALCWPDRHHQLYKTVIG